MSVQTSPGRAVTVGPPGPRVPQPRRLLWRAVGGRPADLLVATTLYSTHQLGEALVPVIIGATISRAVDHGDGWAIALWLGLLAADFAFLSVSYRLGARAAIRAKQLAAHRVRMDLTDRVVRPAGGVDLPPGDLLGRAAGDADRIGGFAGVVAATAAATVALVAATGLLLAASPLLGLIILVGTVVLLVLQAGLARSLHRRSLLEQQALARTTGLAEDLMRGLRVLAGIGAQQPAADGFRRVSRAAVVAGQRRARAEAGLVAAGQLCAGLYLAGICGVGGLLALTGRLGLGALVSALGLAQFVVGPMRVLAAAPAAHARALACARRVDDVLRTPGRAGDPPAGGDPLPAGGAVHLERVPLHGPAIDLHLPSGELTGVVCASPLAAERLALLLARESNPERGVVRLDGVDLAAVPLEEWRRRVLVALHDAALLPGTIGENLGALTDDPIAIARAVEAALAGQVLEVVPAGPDSLVGDQGELLSGGQRQRVALARALAADPPVLVLHDPTTAVDPVTETEMAERVVALRRGRTTVLVTTGPAWLARCDRVWFVSADGVRSGRHAVLLAECPGYRAAVAR